MKTLIINLVRSTDRHERMQRILEQYPSLEIEFIEATDGRQMTTEERMRRFNMGEGDFRCMGKIHAAEIGCTLSHQQCYRKITDGKLPYALILEDDLADGADFESAIPLLRPFLDSPQPRAILLSGKFWWLTSRRLAGDVRIASVFDAYLTHAYLINLAGARLLYDARPGYIADDWRYLIRKGLHLYGLIPHIADQNRAVCGSTISVGRREPLDSRWERIWSRIRREPFKYFRKQLLKQFGHFEPRDKPE